MSDGPIIFVLTEIKFLRAALEEISLGKGPYNRNPLIHAENIIEDMKAIAIGALDGTWKPEADDE